MNDKYALIYFYEYNDNSDPIWNCMVDLEKEIAEAKYDDLKDRVIYVSLLKQIKEN